MADTLEGPARSLFSDRNYAHLSVPRGDGSILTAVVWIDVDERGALVVNSAEGRTWPKLLRRAGQATVSVHNATNPYEFASVTARVTGDTNEGADAVIDALSRKYTDADYADDRTNRVTFTLTPERVTYRG